jgi:hypothetical protein
MRFLSRVFGPSFTEQLVLRLLEENAALRDRLLEQKGVEPINATFVEAQAKPEDAYSIPEDPQARERAIEMCAREAASDPEIMAQAEFNARRNPDWQEVVERAERMMEFVS